MLKNIVFFIKLYNNKNFLFRLIIFKAKPINKNYCRNSLFTNFRDSKIYSFMFKYFLVGFR